jgi:hypothetical protein
MQIIAGTECRVSKTVSGLAIPRKTRENANDLICSTPKPDRITEDKMGWNLEPSKSQFSGRGRAVSTVLPEV